MSKTLYACGLGLVLAATLTGTAYAAPTELHIKPDGTLIATNVLVKQKAGGNYFCRMAWGNNGYARLVIVTNDATTVVKAHGEKASRFDIQEGDTINIEGMLSGIDGSLSIMATKITDFSLLKESKSLSGTVVSTNAASASFVLSNKSFGNTIVFISSTTTIQKGARTISLAEMAAGDKIISVSGTYDHSGNTLTATSVEVRQDQSIFTARNFQGVLKSVTSTVLPATITVTVGGGTDYTVYLPANAAILNKAKTATSLSRFVIGDTVRFYGSIRKTNFVEVDAEVVRDIDF